MASGSGFQFCDDVVHDTLLKSMPNLASLDDEQLSRFCKIVLTFISGRQQAELAAALEKFAEDYSINPKALNGLVKSCLIFFTGALQKNLNQTALADDLKNFGIEAEKVAVICDAWRTMLGMLSAAMVRQTMTAAQIVDLDWKFGVTASSSELGQVGQTFVMLRLKLDQNGSGAEEVTMELSVMQFYEMLQELEKAKAVLEQFS